MLMIVERAGIVFPGSDRASWLNEFHTSEDGVRISSKQSETCRGLLDGSGRSRHIKNRSFCKIIARCIGWVVQSLVSGKGKQLGCSQPGWRSGDTHVSSPASPNACAATHVSLVYSQFSFAFSFPFSPQSSLRLLGLLHRWVDVTLALERQPKIRVPCCTTYVILSLVAVEHDLGNSQGSRIRLQQGTLPVALRHMELVQQLSSNECIATPCTVRNALA
jgi:hypothetical protein